MTGIDIIIYALSGLIVFMGGSVVIGAYTKSKRIKELDNLVDMFYDTEHTWLDVERFCDATGIADITRDRFEEAMKHRATRNLMSPGVYVTKGGAGHEDNPDMEPYDGGEGDEFSPNLSDLPMGYDSVMYKDRHTDWYKYAGRYAKVSTAYLEDDELEYGAVVRIEFYNDGGYLVITSLGRKVHIPEICVFFILPE